MARRRGGVNWIVGCSLKSLEAEIIVYIGVRGDWIGLAWCSAVRCPEFNILQQFHFYKRRLHGWGFHFTPPPV